MGRENGRENLYSNIFFFLIFNLNLTLLLMQYHRSEEVAEKSGD
jgi:hypothetical protein